MAEKHGILFLPEVFFIIDTVSVLSSCILVLTPLTMLAYWKFCRKRDKGTLEIQNMC